jgi:hypothetical protein
VLTALADCSRKDGNKGGCKMKTEQISPQSQSGHNGGETSAPSPTLPDVNFEIYPFDTVQYLLDQVTHLNMFAIPDPAYAETALLTPDDPSDWFGLNGGYGLALCSALHRFDSTVQPGMSSAGPRVTQAVGEAAGMFKCRWLISPDDFAWAPGQYPPPTLFDPWRSQRFVMLDCDFAFGTSADSFQGYGIGRTFPITVHGRPKLLVGAVGNIMAGCGKFEALEGTYVLTGTITSELGFMGSITCRVVDPDGKLRTEREIPPLITRPNPDPDSRFIVLRGVKKDATVKTTYGPPPGGNLVSLVTPAQMRSVRYNFTAQGRGGLRCDMQVGQVVISDYTATVFFDLLAPPGTAQAPVPFSTHEEYPFVDSDGQPIGTITADIVEGVSFNLRFPAAPRQPGVRFAGFGPLTGGTGVFTGIQGMLTVNSVIGISPHTLSLMHVLHLVDPDGRFRMGSNRP